ncbi:MAG: STN domain-containing protein [Gammaproteobacteria bacterium]
MMIKRALFSWLLLLAVAVAGAPAFAQSRIHFDLPSQSLAASLRALGSQASTNVLFESQSVEGRDAPALKAELTLDQALSMLLAGTGLKHRFLDDKTVMVTAVRDAGKSTTDASAAGPPLRLAQEDGTRIDTQAVGGARSAEVGPPAQPSSSDEAESPPEVLVTGTRISRPDFVSQQPIVSVSGSTSRLRARSMSRPRFSSCLSS